MILLMALLQAADCYLTARILANGGRELNPVMHWLYARAGIVGASLVKITIAILAAILLAHVSTAAIAATCIVMAGVVVWNGIQFARGA